ncbi:MAG: hypothetical protein ACYDAG_09180 [Chloroflexota bacterium]
MGIFSEADRHPFEQRTEPVDERRGGAAFGSRREERRSFEYVRRIEEPVRRLFTRDDRAA